MIWPILSVELPSDATCVLKDTDYPGNNMCTLETCELKETPLECQKLCQKTDGCLEFSWVGANADYVEGRKRCWLKNQKHDDPKTVDNIFSGPKTCSKPTYYMKSLIKIGVILCRLNLYHISNVHCLH